MNRRTLTPAQCCPLPAPHGSYPGRGLSGVFRPSQAPFCNRPPSPPNSVYIAPNEDAVREHASQGGFPANQVSRISSIIDPTTAD
ncbi:MAG: DUF4242 domain-containing protein [Myxococcales bacterium]|nr:DUF4242 domain-containing protein [Myxococcales bacterium]